MGQRLHLGRLLSQEESITRDRRIAAVTHVIVNFLFIIFPYKKFGYFGLILVFTFV